MRVGEIEIVPIECGEFRLDGGAMFGVIPKVLWERHAPADERNRIVLAMRAMLIRAAQENILVDTGVGEELPQKLRDIYAVDHHCSSLAQSLEGAGLGLEEITRVVLTHLHFDHTGGATHTDESGKVVPSFPNATYYVQKQQYEWALNPDERDRASYVRRYFVPLEQHGCLELLDGEEEIAPGVRVIPIHGHSPGQQLVKVSASGETLLYCADLIPTAAHLPLPWVMSYDLQPVVTVAEKKAILGTAAADGWTLFYEHDPDIIASRVVKDEKGYHSQEPLWRSHSSG